MPAIAHVDLAVDNATNDATSPTNIGSASSALTASAPTLILAMGHGSTTGGGSAFVDLLVNGMRVALMGQLQNFGGNSDLDTALSGMAQMCCAYLHTPAGGSETMQFRGWCEDIDFFATGCRAYALDLSDIDEDDGRWHEQTANSDTVVTTPTSGWTTLGNALVFTAPRTGNYLIIASCEAQPDTTGDAFDLPHVRFSQNGTPIAGTHDAGEIGVDVVNGSRGYMTAHVRTLTEAVEYTFALEANGTDSAGNIGYRRIRLHAIEVAQIEDDDVQQDLDTAGQAIVGTGTYDACALVLDPPASRDFLLLGTFQHESTWWVRGRFTVEGTGVDDGFNTAGYDAGLGADADLSHVMGLHIATGVAVATDVGLQYETGAGATGAGGEGHVGAAAANTDAADITFIALRLQTSSAEPLVALPDAARMRVQTGTPTSTLGAVSTAPSVQRMRIQDGAPTFVLGALSVTPSSQRVRFQDGVASVTLGALAITPASQRLRFRDGGVGFPITRTFDAERIRIQTGTVTPVVGARVFTPSVARLRFRTGLLANNIIDLGALRASVREDQVFGATVREASRFGLRANDVD
jgi:hypothetical protein